MIVKDNLHVHFEHGIEVAVNLQNVKMSQEQRSILNKLVSKIDNLDTAECTKAGCPAQKYLSAEEFQKIRGLTATLTPSKPGIAAAGPFIDFCLHVINVGHAGPGEL